MASIRMLSGDARFQGVTHLLQYVPISLAILSASYESPDASLGKTPNVSWRNYVRNCLDEVLYFSPVLSFHHMFYHARSAILSEVRTTKLITKLIRLRHPKDFFCQPVSIKLLGPVQCSCGMLDQVVTAVCRIVVICGNKFQNKLHIRRPWMIFIFQVFINLFYKGLNFFQRVRIVDICLRKNTL